MPASDGPLGFHAVHVPDFYGGEGADSVATCSVIEKVARVCASSSLIYGHTRPHPPTVGAQA